MYLQQSKTKEAKYKKKITIDWGSPSQFETPVFKDFFSFINFTFVTQKWENENALIELVTRDEIVIF